MNNSILKSSLSDCCIECGRPLIPDEIGLTKKLVNRGRTTYFCITCLARHFDVEEKVLEQKIQEFREMGCALFAGEAKYK